MELHLGDDGDDDSQTDTEKGDISSESGSEGSASSRCETGGSCDTWRWIRRQWKAICIEQRKRKNSFGADR